MWTGEKIGVLGFRRHARFGAEKYEDEDDAAGSETGNEEKQFGWMMRRALERQADEVRFVRGLGLSSSP